MPIKHSLLAALAFSSGALAKKCTTVTDAYPFFLYAYNDGVILQGKPLNLFNTDPAHSGPIGLAINYPESEYPATFKFHKKNLLAGTSALGGDWISTSLQDNSFLTFDHYNASTKPQEYGLLGLQQYEHDVESLGENACILTVNHAVVPLTLCPADPSSRGRLYVTYASDASRYCLNVQVLAYSQGGPPPSRLE